MNKICQILLVSVLFTFATFPPPISFCEEVVINQAQAGLEPSKDGYLITPADEVEIRVVGEDDLSNVYKVDNEGNISFPILGKIHIADMTLRQVENKITKELEKDYFKTRVSLDAQIKKFHDRSVMISGEIVRPGSYKFSEDRDTSLVELISRAGGPTEKACMNAVTIIRPVGEGGKTKTIKIRAGDIMEGKEKDVILNSGDRVKIPNANVIVMGEVAKPGTYGFGDASKMTLLGAISMAGGFTRIAAINAVNIIRVDELGNEKKIKVNVNNIYNGRGKDVSLEPGDIIVVHESWF